MPVCKITGTLTHPNGRAATGTFVEARKSDFTSQGRITNSPIRVRCNQQGEFELPVEQGEDFRITITELGIQITVTAPALATATLDSLTP
jgi:hypothetical protein